MVNKRANAGRRLRGKEKRASWDKRNKGRAFIEKERFRWNGSDDREKKGIGWKDG